MTWTYRHRAPARELLRAAPLALPLVHAAGSPLVALWLLGLPHRSALAGEALWALFELVSILAAMATVAFRDVPSGRRVQVDLEPEGRIRVDGEVVDLSRAVAVDVEGAAVVVCDADGREVWTYDGLPSVWARCLALDLSEALGLAIPEAVGRVPDGGGDAPQVRQDHHVVAFRTWSGPARTRLDELSSSLGMAPPSLGGFHPVHLLACVPLVIGKVIWLAPLLTLLAPIRIDLAIGPDVLVVRTGIRGRERRIPIAMLRPPRVVADETDRASLLLRSEDGWSCEIRRRPRAELEQIAWWIEHARARAVPALPEPVPEVPAELERLRQRVD